MYLSLAAATVHTTHEWQPRSERGEPLPWPGDHILILRLFLSLRYGIPVLHTEGKASAARLKLLPSWIVCI